MRKRKASIGGEESSISAVTLQTQFITVLLHRKLPIYQFSSPLRVCISVPARILLAEWISVRQVKLYDQKKGQNYLISKQQLTNGRVIFVFYNCSNNLQHRCYP